MTPELEALKREIERTLDQNLPQSSDIAQPMVEAMRHSVLGGGKRLRPMLVCATSQACGQSLEAALPAACAVEFIHAYSLIHDDLPAMDNDELRHGLPATHIKYGEANAILAGDSLHSLAFETVAGSGGQSHEVRLKMIELLASAAGWTGMSGGQCLDIEAEGRELGLAELQNLHSAKTGALIRVSVQLGALSSDGNVSPEQFALLTEYGDRIGLAFQVMDDVLEVTQSTEELGKPAGSDEALQKNTFPKLMGLGQATALAETLVNESIALLERTRLETHSLQQLARMVVDRSH
ncbi:MAG: farnesyl diphosphate synthase [Limisphaerales bacterium]|jgi:farnesyl diphosphate synthase